MSLKIAVACTTLWPCWFDQHEGAGAWLGAIATFMAACVALLLPFLLRWLDRVDTDRQLAWDSFLAAHHARGALLLIMELQRERFATGQNPLNATNRQWAFELDVADGTLAFLMEAKLRDPALLPHLVSARAWTQVALQTLDLSPADGLFQMQYSTAAREQAASDLLRLQHQFLEFATKTFPRRLRRPRPLPLRAHHFDVTAKNS